MTGILSLLTFLPVGGVAAIVALRLFADPKKQAETEHRAKIIALVTTVADFALAVLMVANFDRGASAFQFVEEIPWFGGLNYRMGVDGISVLFVLLNTFLLPLCILASWKSVERRALEYLVAFLVLATLITGAFHSPDIVRFLLFLAGGLAA